MIYSRNYYRFEDETSDSYLEFKRSGIDSEVFIYEAGTRGLPSTFSKELGKTEFDNIMERLRFGMEGGNWQEITIPEEQTDEYKFKKETVQTLNDFHDWLEND